MDDKQKKTVEKAYVYKFNDENTCVKTTEENITTTTTKSSHTFEYTHLSIAWYIC